jgi:hypothetical protein
MPGMIKKDAWLYAASWGSFISSGDPGACLYGFDERFRVQSEEHRADCLAEMERNRAHVVATPADYEAGELDKLDSFVEALKAAKLESEPGALDGCDEFTAAYIEALFFTDSAADAETAAEFAEREADGGAEGRFPSGACADDIAPESLARIVRDCAAFQAQAADLLAAAYQRPGYDAARAGHDFWLTRNRHGAGFWCREELDAREEFEALGRPRVDDPNWDEFAKARANSLGDRLSAVAKGFGEVDTYFGDDSQIHL